MHHLLINEGRVLFGGDVWKTFLFALLLVYAGQIIVAEHDRARIFGIRLSGIGFIFYLAFQFSVIDEIDSSGFVSILMMGSVLSLLLLGSLWIVLPPLAGLYSLLVDGPKRYIQRSCRSFRLKQQQKTEAQERKESRLEWERTRPERERAEREATERKRCEKEQRQDDQRRREAVRFECRLLFDRHASEIKESLSLKRFQSYLDTELSDQFSPDLVEERGEQLKMMILDFFECQEPQQESRSSTEIVEHYHLKRSQISKAEYDTETKAALLAHLNLAEDRALRNVEKS